MLIVVLVTFCFRLRVLQVFFAQLLLFTDIFTFKNAVCCSILFILSCCYDGVGIFLLL